MSLVEHLGVSQVLCVSQVLLYLDYLNIDGVALSGIRVVYLVGGLLKHGLILYLDFEV